MIANKADLAFIAHAELTSTPVLAYLADLRELSPMPEVADRIDHCERMIYLDTMVLIARQGMSFLEGFSKDDYTPPESSGVWSKLFTRSINWDPALRNANFWFDRDVAALRLKDREARVKELTAIVQDFKSLKLRVGNTGIIEKTLWQANDRGEMIGHIMIALMTPAFDKLQDATERCEQTKRNLHVAFALAAYQSDHGRYPATLAELAPKYLNQIPDDLFSGKPLIYRPEDNGYLLYSVGVNGIDEDGNGYDDEPRGDDLSVRVPAPKPRGKD